MSSLRFSGRKPPPFFSRSLRSVFTHKTVLDYKPSYILDVVQQFLRKHRCTSKNKRSTRTYEIIINRKRLSSRKIENNVVVYVKCFRYSRQNRRTYRCGISLRDGFYLTILWIIFIFIHNLNRNRCSRDSDRFRRRPINHFLFHSVFTWTNSLLDFNKTFIWTFVCKRSCPELKMLYFEHIKLFELLVF